MLWLAATAAVRGEWLLPEVDPDQPIRVHAAEMGVGEMGEYRVYRFRGQCVLQQGDLLATAARMTLWVDRRSEFFGDRPAMVLVEAEEDVAVQFSPTDRIEDHRWQHRLFTLRELQVAADSKVDFVPDVGRPSDFDVKGYPPVPTASTGEVQHAQYLLPPPQPTAQPLIGPESIPATPYRAADGYGGAGAFDGSSFPSGGIELDLQGNIVGGPAGAPPVPRDAYQLPSPATQPPAASPPLSAMPPGAVNPGRIPESLGGPTLIPEVDPQTGLMAEPAVLPSIGARSFAFSGRGSTPPAVETHADPVRGETVVVISRGLRLQFNGAGYRGGGGVVDLGTVLLEADRAVIWTSDLQRLYGGNVEGLPIEVYLEGNVVFQQGERKIYADRMYYNPQAELGTILGAEILTPVPQYEGILRLKADVVQQRSRQNFMAYDAAITSSRLGVPRYWLQADRLELADEREVGDVADYQELTRVGTTEMEATARNNFVYVGGVPVFYWPFLNTNIDTPSFYVRSIRFKNDQIFGQQIGIDTDLYQILGIDGPDGTDWRLSTDYFSKRGPAIGTTYRYNVPEFAFGGPATGFIDAWGIDDEGLDILGSDRFNLVPESQTRGRVLARHRQLLSRDLEFRSEVGYISDRNFLEQFFEREFDEEKDQTTNARLRRYDGNRLFDIWAQVRLNDFFLETEWLPRADFHWLGEPLFDRLTYYSYTHAGYARLRAADPPQDPQDAAKFSLLPFEANTSGIRAGTRQEIDAPFNLGPVRVVPYIGGEIITYGEDLTGDSLTRSTGQAGVRSTLPVVGVYEGVQSRIFNVNGLAHKLNYNAEFFYADSSENIEQIPLLDPLDDNAQEQFRRRLIFNTFGGTLPPQFDSRSYAIRQGLQRYVTAMSPDVVEDQMQFRIGLDQRLQTKRGLPGRERIADLLEFDVSAILFPKQERDNFGETVGGINFDSRLHLGDRFTILGDGYADVFEDGLKVLSLGYMVTRPGRFDYYSGVTRLTGPIDSTVLHSNINYRMNEKFIISGGSTFDLGEVGNVGQSFSLTRVGESFLTQVGVTVDSGRDNASFNFALEPRFLSIRGLGAVGGRLVPPAGLLGVE